MSNIPTVLINRLRRFAGLLALLTAALILPAPQAIAQGAEGDSAPSFASDEYDRYSTNLIAQIVKSYHYQRPSLNDSYSESVLDLYLDQIDPYKIHFTDSDLDRFESWRYNFDNAFSNGEVEISFEIYNTYLARAVKRLQYYQQIASNHTFNFKVNESLVFEPEKIAWARNDTQLKDRWRKWVKNDYLSLLLDETSEKDIRKQLTERYARLVDIYEQTRHQDAYATAINAYLGVLDPHTSYLSPQDQKTFSIHMSLSLEGIGAVLRSERNYTLIHRIIPGGPVSRDGSLKTGDRIIGVRSKPGEEIVDVRGWRLNDVVELIRGPKESQVQLRVLKEHQKPGDTAAIVSLVRDRIDLDDQAAQGHRVRVGGDKKNSQAKRIGIIRVPTFYHDFKARQSGNKNYRSSTRDVADLIKELKKDSIDGLLIDLRGNGGGALEEAVNLVGLFIDLGAVVQVRSYDGKVQVNKDTSPGVVYSGKLAVLIDRNSASASEIFSGAIQDYGRGLVLGETSFGKGTVQHLFNLNKMSMESIDKELGQLKITIAQFFRINGESTQYRGVVPDITMYPEYERQRYGESALEYALPWVKIRPAKYRQEYPEAKRLELGIPILSKRHLSRRQENKELSALWESYQIQSQTQQQRSLSLNLKVREKERDERSDLPSTTLPDQYEKLEDSYKEDTILKEASHILSDYIRLSANQITANKDS